ncbi:MAG: CPBP family intramembrane glutamic endopeptidase [Leptospirales bacterium]
MKSKSKALRNIVVFGSILVPFAITLLLSLSLVLIGVLPQVVSQWSSAHFLIQVSTQASVFLLYVALMVRFVKVDLYYWGGNINPMELILAIFGWVLVSMLITALVEFIGLDTEQFLEIDFDSLKPTWILFAIATTIIAPIYEEVTYRGFLLKFFVGKKKPGVWRQVFAAIFTSLIFALVHESQAWLPVFILSLYLSALTLYKKSIMLSIIIHSMQNFITVIGIFFID